MVTNCYDINCRERLVLRVERGCQALNLSSIPFRLTPLYIA